MKHFKVLEIICSYYKKLKYMILDKDDLTDYKIKNEEMRIIPYDIFKDKNKDIMVTAEQKELLKDILKTGRNT